MRLRYFGSLLLLFASLQYLCGLNEFWDDSFIAMLYSRNIARGIGPVFLPASQVETTSHAFVEGYSNPLWVFLLAAFYVMPGSVFFWVRLTSFLSAGLLAFSCSGLLKDLVSTRDRPVPGWAIALPGLLVLLDSSVFIYVKSGMETVTFTALVVTALWHTSRVAEADRKGPLVLNALLWFLVVLTRPEGIIYAVTGGAFIAGWRWYAGKQLTRTVWWFVPMLTLVAAFYLWRYGYYHEFLPNTYYAKVANRGTRSLTGWIHLFQAGVLYVLQFVGRDLPRAALGSALLGLLWARCFSRRVLLVLVMGILANILFAVSVGGDFWPLSRFLQVTGSLVTVFAAVPVAMLTIGRRLPDLGSRWSLQAGNGWGAVAALLLIVAQPLFAHVTNPVFYGDLPLSSRKRVEEALTARHITPQLILGKWLKENLPMDALVALDQAGQIPYYCDRQVVDVLGLNDHYLARHPIEYGYLQKRGVTHLAAAVVLTGGRRNLLYPQLLDSDFRRDFRLTHLFEGVDQNQQIQTFVLFTRLDLLTSEETAELSDNGERVSLEELLERGPSATRLEPSLVHDLSP